MSPAGWLSTPASTSAGTGSSATSRMASRLARRLVIVVLVVPFGAARRGGILVAGRGGPAHEELAQRRQLVHGDPAFPVEIQHGEKPRDHLVGARAVRGQPAERGPAQLAQPPGDDLGLLTHGGAGRMQVI